MKRKIAVSLFLLLVFAWPSLAQESRQVIAPNNADNLRRLLTVGRGHITSLAFSPDGLWLATGSANGPIQIWDLDTRDEVARWEGASAVTRLAFSPDGTLLAAGYDSAQVEIWDVAEGEPIQTLDNPVVVITQGESALICDLAFSSDGRRLAVTTCETSDDDAYQMTRVWDTESWDAANQVEGTSKNVSFDADGSTLVIVINRVVYAWDLESDTRTEIVSLDAPIAGMAFSPERDLLALSDYERHWYLSPPNSNPQQRHARVNTITDIVFSPDARVLVTLESSEVPEQPRLFANRLVSLWSTRTRNRLVTLNLQPYRVLHTMAINAQGTLLAFGTDAGAQVWGITEEEPEPLAVDDDCVDCIDTDEDGVTDTEDNCPRIANTDQGNADGDELGDLCDECPNSVAVDTFNDICVFDEDGDRVLDIEDNCPYVQNREQTDVDQDRLGDDCDPDMDNDGLGNARDDCPTTYGTSVLDRQGCLDSDQDGLSNPADNCPFATGSSTLDVQGCPDDDLDGWSDGGDNCPFAENVSQTDFDGDDEGDVCDPDDDNDGADDLGDACPLVAGSSTEDVAGCPDEDGDGWSDEGDNCPLAANPSQLDTDSDDAGDLCDLDDDGDEIADAGDDCPLVKGTSTKDVAGCPDEDGDGWSDTGDNCPAVSNPDQANTDGDALGNLCDSDDDGDSVNDGSDDCPLVAGSSTEDAAGCPDGDGDGWSDTGDNCPSAPNPDQADTDGDGSGDACDAAPVVADVELACTVNVLLNDTSGILTESSISVGNNGTDTADVTIQVTADCTGAPLPTNVSSSVDTGSLVGSTWTITGLAPGASGRFTFVCDSVTESPHSLTVSLNGSASGSLPDPVPGNNVCSRSEIIGSQ